MKSTPSPRVRFLAVLALILCAGIGAYLLIHGSGGASSAGSDTTGAQAITRTTTRAQTTTTSSKKTHKRRHRTPVEGVAALDAALVAHPLVVVSVYARNVTTDTSAMKEAKAGAAEVGAGFVAFDVYREKLARQLATLLSDSTDVTNPEVLFFKRPRTLAFELKGFSDSQVVAQAAQNVFPRVEPWVGQANTICARFAASLGAAQTQIRNSDLSTNAGRKRIAAALEQAVGLLNREAKALAQVRATEGKAKDYVRLIADLKQVSSNMGSEAGAVRRNDQTAARASEQANTQLIAAMNALASNLELTSCAS